MEHQEPWPGLAHQHGFLRCIGFSAGSGRGVMKYFFDERFRLPPSCHDHRCDPFSCPASIGLHCGHAACDPLRRWSPDVGGFSPVCPLSGILHEIISGKRDAQVNARLFCAYAGPSIQCHRYLGWSRNAPTALPASNCIVHVYCFPFAWSGDKSYGGRKWREFDLVQNERDSQLYFHGGGPGSGAAPQPSAAQPAAAQPFATQAPGNQITTNQP